MIPVSRSHFASPKLFQLKSRTYLRMKTNRITVALAAICAFVLGLSSSAAAGVEHDNAMRNLTVSFDSASSDASYEGTLTLPDGDGPFPGIILLSVAGPNDRDQTVGDNRGFADLAAAFAAQGIASYRFDDRGVGGSSGDYFAASWEVLAEDAAQAFDTIAAHPKVDAGRLGFAGMSQGAALAAMASRSRPESGAVILLSAPGLAGEDALKGQLETNLAAMQVPEFQAAQFRGLMDQFLGIIRDRSDSQFSEMEQFLSGPGRQLIPPYSFVPKDVRGLTEMVLGPWYTSNVTFDPQTTYQIAQPVMVVAGGLDPVAPPTTHLDQIREILAQKSASSVTVLEFPDGNHLLQRSVTGSPLEYPQIDHGIAPDIAAAIAAWARIHLAR